MVGFGGGHLGSCLGSFTGLAGLHGAAVAGQQQSGAFPPLSGGRGDSRRMVIPPPGYRSIPCGRQTTAGRDLVPLPDSGRRFFRTATTATTGMGAGAVLSALPAFRSWDAGFCRAVEKTVCLAFRGVNWRREPENVRTRQFLQAMVFGPDAACPPSPAFVRQENRRKHGAPFDPDPQT